MFVSFVVLQIGVERMLGLRRFLLQCVFLAVLGSLCLSGCRSASQLFPPPKNKPLPGGGSMLTPLVSEAGTVTLDVFYVRCPYGDPVLNQELWMDVDEQVLSPQKRADLAANGFRAGILGNQIPTTLLRLMQDGDDETIRNKDGMTIVRLEDMANTPRVMRKTVPAKNNQRNDILVSEVLPTATVLFNENGVPGGETFDDAQAVFVVRTQTCGDGKIDISILPETQYGQVHQQYTREAGSVVMAPGRSKRTFDRLAMSFKVTPGQVIVISNLDKQQGNVGDFFLTDYEKDMQYQKLMCLRVLYSQDSVLNSDDGDMPMDPVQLPERIEDDSDHQTIPEDSASTESTMSALSEPSDSEKVGEGETGGTSVL